MSRERSLQEDSDLGSGGLPEPQRLAYSRSGMVASAHPIATAAGARMLEQGGNAVDAAVASALALGVVEPHASGLGGQTMLLLHLAEPRSTVALDGSSRAPNRLDPGDLAKDELLRGWCATTVPSTPAVLAYAQRTYGKLDWRAALEPAIEAAERGFQVSALFHRLSKREAKRLRKRNSGRVFLSPSGRPLAPGRVLRQPVLAKTLERLAEHDVEDFYQGRIAETIDADMRTNAGLLRLDDLAQIPWPVERRPLSHRFQGQRVVTLAPPGAGRVLVAMLDLLERFDPKLWTPDSPEGAVMLAEIMRTAQASRLDRPIDPALFPQERSGDPLAPDNLDKTARRVKRVVKKVRTRGETTHLSVMDAEGNCVALTQSIERVFGSFVLSEELGFLYNNYMSAFELEDISHPYYLRPNGVPWASVAPTIVFRGRRPALVLGSPGSERIVSAILQVLLRLRTLPPFESVAAPRLHCSAKGRVSLESPRFRDDIPAALERAGFEVDPRDSYSFYLGCVQAVLRDRGGFVGVADPRRDGSASGPKA